MTKNSKATEVPLKGKRVIIVDKHIVSWSGHWMQYAVDLGELFTEKGARLSIVVNKLFGKGAFKDQKAGLEKLNYKPEICKVLYQPAFYKKRHPYEKLKRKRYSLGEKVTNWFLRPGSMRAVLFFTFADYRLNNFKSPRQLISFFTRYTNPLALAGGALMAGVGAGLIAARRSRYSEWSGRLIERMNDQTKAKVEAKAQRKYRPRSALIDRFFFALKQLQGYRKMYSRLDPGPEDIIVFQTADEADIVALERVVSKNGRWGQAKHKLILRTPIWDQDGNFSEPPEEAKLLRKTLLDLMNVIPNLSLYVDTEEMQDQYKSLGFFDVGLIPILYGKSLEDQFDSIAVGKDSPPVGPRRLTIIRSGNASREKGFSILPDLVKAAQIERQNTGINLGFIIQATMLRFQPRWDAVYDTLTRLRWFSENDVKIITSEVSTEDYIENLLNSDIVISPNRSIPYMHGSTGTTLEALRSSKPLVTLGENWGARQLRNLDVYVDHLLQFSKKHSIEVFNDHVMIDDVNAFDIDGIDMENTWNPFCAVYLWQISLTVARRFALRVPKNATHLVITMKNGNKPLPGDVAKIGIHGKRDRESLAGDRARRHSFQFLDPVAQSVVWRPFGAKRPVTANIWKLRPGTDWIFGGLVMLDRRCSVSELSVDIAFCANPNSSEPMSAGGIIADNVLELAEGMFEVGRHFEHYRETARVGGNAIQKFHNRQTFWDQFMS